MSVLNIKFDKPTIDVRVPENATGLSIPLFSFHPGGESQQIMLFSPELGTLLSVVCQSNKGITVAVTLQFPVDNYKRLTFYVKTFDGKAPSKEGHLIVHYDWIIDPNNIPEEEYFQFGESKSAK